jgi:hypothetical protein
MEYAQPKYNGEPTIKAIANGLGTLGRYGDSYMVHAAEGETVVPAEILDANPELKQHLFWQMRMMGIKDPNRYVVGNNLNSINPVTGQPEFFFKKIWKKVKKVFKKVLPIIAPIVGNLIAPGIGGIIASGLVTKLQGGSWGDVLRSAALSYGVGAFAQGVGGGLAGLGSGGAGFGSGFASGLGTGLTAPFSAAANLFSSGATNPLAQGIFGPGGFNAIFTGAGSTLSPTGTAPTTGLILPGATTPVGSSTLGYTGGLFPTYNAVAGAAGAAPTSVQGPPPAGSQITTQPAVAAGNYPVAPPVVPKQPSVPLVPTPPSPLVTPTVFSATTPETQAQLRLSQSSVPEGYYDQFTQPTVTQAVAGEQPNIASQIIFGEGEGGTAGGFKRLGEWGIEKATSGPVLAAVGSSALGYFMTDDPDDLPDENKPLAGTAKANAYDEYLKRGRLKDAEGIRLLREAGIAPVQDAQAISTSTGISLEDAQAFIDNYYGSLEAADLSGTTVPSGLESVVSGQTIQPIQIPNPQTILSGGPLIGAARGGIVNLQGGGEIIGPGSGTSDSIPARLSDGEFVMTSDAVRGAGNGNRDLGAARMYDMMSRYERGVA